MYLSVSSLISLFMYVCSSISCWILLSSIIFHFFFLACRSAHVISSPKFNFCSLARSWAKNKENYVLSSLHVYMHLYWMTWQYIHACNYVFGLKLITNFSWSEVFVPDFKKVKYLNETKKILPRNHDQSIFKLTQWF